MSERETFKQKAKRTCLIVLQYVFMAIAVVSIFFISISISMLFYGYKIEAIGTGILFMAVAMLVSVFFVTIAEKGLRRIEPRYEGFEASYRGNLKIMAFALAALLGVIASSSVLNAYFGLLPATIGKTLRVEIFKTVIQADGFLIGLSGIVFAQMFWAINHQQGNIQVELLKERKQGETFERDVRTQFVRVLDRKRTRMAMMMFLVVVIFAGSVALSLSGMARTDLYATDLTPTSPDVVNPLWLMFLGIAAFVISIATSKMSLEEDIGKVKTKTPDSN